MTTVDDFRRIALSMPDASEGEHMGHPDFRVRGRIFATLHPDGERGMVILAPERQLALVEAQPDVFVPANGAWGRKGCTMVRLGAIGQQKLRAAVTEAWQRAIESPAPRRRQSARGATSSPSSSGKTARATTQSKRRPRR